jgi:hypothetical protein
MPIAPPTKAYHDPTAPGRLAEPIIIARIWKSPRDRKRTIVIALKQYEGHDFLDCRLFDTNSEGQSVPTARGLTVGIPKLLEFAAAIAKAVERARQLGLLSVDGGAK